MSSDLDRIDELLRKPKQVGKPETKIPLVEPEKYPQLWHDTQEELDSYDSLMRKKVYFQNSYGEKLEKDFIQNGNKPTFGIFTKEFRERKFQVSNLLKNQREYLENLKKSTEYKKLTERRYHTWSDYDYTWEHYLKYIKAFGLFMILRELPLKNFYARCFIVGTGLYYANYHWFNFLGKTRYYANERDMREFDNYPRLKEIVTKRISNKEVSPTMLESDYWWILQSPVFYHHHIKHYRYMYRVRREVPWDGTYNQPILPYHLLNDRTGFVHAGLTESVEPKPNAAW